MSGVKYEVFCSMPLSLQPSCGIEPQLGGKSKGKDLPQQAKGAQGVPCSLRPRIFLTFGTTSGVGSQPYTPAAFTRGEIPGTHFRG